MKGKTLILAGLFCTMTLLPGCGLYNSWFGSTPEAAPVEEPAAVETPVAEPTPPAVPEKPLTAKERKKLAAEEKKKAEETRKQAERDRKAGKVAKADPQDVVQARLNSFATSHLERANVTLRPNKAHKEVRREGSQYCAFYSEVDVVTLKTELYQVNKPGAQYVGHVIYIENTIASYGATEREARNGVFKQIKSKRVRELTRYADGKWHY